MTWVIFCLTSCVFSWELHKSLEVFCFKWIQAKGLTTLEMPLCCIPILLFSIFLHHQKTPNHPCSGWNSQHQSSSEPSYHLLTLHIFYSVLLALTFRSSQSHQQNGNEALKLWRSKEDTRIHSTILLQHFLFLQSQHLMVSFLEYFLTIFSESKLSVAHLQNTCSFEEPSHSNPKSRIHSISTTSPHLLPWVCVQGFVSGGLQGWKLLPGTRASASQLQDGPAAGQGQAVPLTEAAPLK